MREFVTNAVMERRMCTAEKKVNLWCNPPPKDGVLQMFSSVFHRKWDTLPTQEGNAVMANIINKLSQCLLDVDINSQIIRLSTSEALAAEKHGVMNSEFASLTE